MTRPLDAVRLGAIPERVPAVRRVVVLERTGSTNDEARRLAVEGAPAWTAVVAGRQDGGRGRLGRSWFSPEGLGLYLSVLLRPRRPAPEAARWTLAAAAAAAECCAATGAGAIAIKWPNDVLAAGRKVAGILAELRTGSDGTHELIVGAGFNVHHAAADFPAPLRPVATSLAAAGARPETTREGLAESWLARFAEFAEELDRDRWPSVAACWTRWAPGAEGRAVRVSSSEAGAAGRVGVTRGLDRFGALRVETASGETIVVRIADSVVPLEG